MKKNDNSPMTNLHRRDFLKTAGAAALGALSAQLAEIRTAKEDWFVGAGRVDKEDVSLEADGAVIVRRQPLFA